MVAIGVEEVPTENSKKLTYEYEQIGAKEARKREAELTERLKKYLSDLGHHVARYKIKTPGSGQYQFSSPTWPTQMRASSTKRRATPTAPASDSGRSLDYGRHVKAHLDGAELALLLPEGPPGDMIELLESLGVGCVVEEEPASSQTSPP